MTNLGMSVYSSQASPLGSGGTWVTLVVIIRALVVGSTVTSYGSGSDSSGSGGSSGGTDGGICDGIG